MNKKFPAGIFIFIFCLTGNISAVQKKDNTRARDLEIPFTWTPGKFNSITDVPGIEVGYKTLINGNGVSENFQAWMWLIFLSGYPSSLKHGMEY